MDAFELGSRFHLDIERVTSQLWFLFTSCESWEEAKRYDILKYLTAINSSGYAITHGWIHEGFQSPCKNCGMELSDHAGFQRCLFDNHDFVEYGPPPAANVSSVRALKLMVIAWYEHPRAKVIKIGNAVVPPSWAKT